MAENFLSKRALEILNRAGEIKSEMEYYRQDRGLPREIRNFMRWLGEYLRFELKREDWEEPQMVADDGLTLYLYSPTWQLQGEKRVALSFWWRPDPSASDFDCPCVMLYLQPESLFPARNALLKELRPTLIRGGFTDHAPYDIDPAFPIWKGIEIDKFHTESGFDLDGFVSAIADGFRRLAEIEPLIGDALLAMPQTAITLPSERTLKTIAILDTEWAGTGGSRKMTELAILNVAYEVEGDEVVGVLGAYYMELGQILDEAKARATLERADFIVAHNATTADKPLIARYLPETEKMNWLCSLRGGVPWKELLGVQSESLETLMGSVGLSYAQVHTARADAHDLKRLLAQRRNGRTFLGRLLDASRVEAVGLPAQVAVGGSST